MTARRIGILGGTFDPIHQGHLDAAHAAEETLGLTQILVVPSAVPPHRPQPGASSYHRFAMVALAVAGRAGWRATDIELRDHRRSYTSATLRKFHDRGYSPSELFFIVGADAFADIASWFDFPKILDHAHFAVVSRPKLAARDLPRRLPKLAHRMEEIPSDKTTSDSPLIFLIEAQTAEVSSSAIRALRSRSEPIDGMVPDNVQRHIEQHGLYTPMSRGRRANDPPPPPAAGRLHGQD